MRGYLMAPRYVGAAILALAVSAVFAGVGFAADGKQYSATIDPLSAAAGAATSFRYTVKNLDAQQPLGAFRVSIPAGGWAVSGASVTVTSSPSGKTWSVTPNTVSAGYIEAKASSNNARLAKDQSVVVTFTATAPCSGGPFVFQSVAHQANQFQGPNNEFIQANSDTNRTVALPGGGGAIASVSIDPVGTPKTAGEPFDVTVRTFNGCGNPTTGAASATLAGFNPSPPPTSKSMDVAPPAPGSGSVATFSVTAYNVETAGLVATVGTITSLPTSGIQVVPGKLGRFTLDPIGSPQRAGVPITVVARPFDKWGNAKTNYTGGASLSGNLSSSTKAGPPVPPTTSPVYGSFVWGANGVGTATVTAKKAESGRQVVVTDATDPLSPAVTASSSPPFVVQPGTLTLVFTKQPGAAKFDAPIPSTSAPDPITVLAEDAYGNAAPDGTGVTMIAPGILSGTLSATTVGGLAKYTNLRIATVGIYRLIARLDGVSPIVTATSDPFAIANDLQNCTNVSLCTSTASTGNQSSTARITTSSTTFQNIVLTTTFFDASGSNCSGFTPIPGTKLTDVSIQSGNVDRRRANVPGHSHHPQGDPPGGGLHPAIG